MLFPSMELPQCGMPSCMYESQVCIDDSLIKSQKYTFTYVLGSLHQLMLIHIYRVVPELFDEMGILVGVLI